MNSLLDQNAPTTGLGPCDVSLIEALKIFWSLYWRSSLLATLILLLFPWLFGIALGYWSLQLWGLLLWAQLLFLALPRIVKPYRGFRVSLIGPMEETVPLTQPNKLAILGFFAPRYVLGSLVFGFVLSPVNILWGIMQLPYGAFITTNFAVLATGTLCIRMMIGHAFKAFTLRVDR